MSGGGGEPMQSGFKLFRSGIAVIMQNAFTAKVILNKEFQRGPCDTCLRSLRACISFRRFFPTELIGEEAYCYSGAAEIGSFWRSRSVSHLSTPGVSKMT
jgi:hypothetical protein